MGDGLAATRKVDAPQKKAAQKSRLTRMRFVPVFSRHRAKRRPAADRCMAGRCCPKRDRISTGSCTS